MKVVRLINMAIHWKLEQPQQMVLLLHLIFKPPNGTKTGT